MMSLNEYQTAASDTAVYPQPVKSPERDSWEWNIGYLTIKLNGEAGEVAEKIGKGLRGDYPVQSKRGEILLELGDVLWYISQIAKELGYDLSEVAQANIDKLTSRKARLTLHGDGDTR